MMKGNSFKIFLILISIILLGAATVTGSVKFYENLHIGGGYNDSDGGTTLDHQGNADFSGDIRADDITANNLYGNYAINFNDLIDVVLASPTNEDFIYYDTSTSKWINGSIDIDMIPGMNIVSPSNANLLIYNAVTSSFENVGILGDIGINETGLTTYLGNIDDLPNVEITTPSTGEYLQYDGTDWVNEAFTLSVNFDDLEDVNISSPSNGSIVLYSITGWTNVNISGDGSLNYDGSLTVEIPSTQITDINWTGLADEYILKWDAYENGWVVSPDSADLTVHSIEELLDVDLTDNADTYILAWDDTNSKYIPTPHDGNLENQDLKDIGDVDIVGIADGYILKWDQTNAKWFVGEDSVASGAMTEADWENNTSDVIDFVTDNDDDYPYIPDSSSGSIEQVWMKGASAGYWGDAPGDDMGSIDTEGKLETVIGLNLFSENDLIPAVNIGTGLTDTQVNDNITISDSGSVHPQAINYSDLSDLTDELITDYLILWDVSSLTWKKISVEEVFDCTKFNSEGLWSDAGDYIAPKNAAGVHIEDDGDVVTSGALDIESGPVSIGTASGDTYLMKSQFEGSEILTSKDRSAFEGHIIWSEGSHSMSNIHGVVGRATVGTDYLSSSTEVIGVRGLAMTGPVFSDIYRGIGLKGQVLLNQSGKISNGVAIYGGTAGSVGSVSNLYGLYVEDITKGSASNYAVYTGLGACRFGDDVTVAGDLEVQGGSLVSPGDFAVSANGGSGAVTVSGSLSTPAVVTFSANDTTPSVAGANIFRVPNTWSAGNDITNLDDGAAGQRVTVVGGDADCVFTDNANLQLSGAWTAEPNDTLVLIHVDGAWYETSRSDN
jgi:hypothetical protein